jgi:tryptophan halogenase
MRVVIVGGGTAGHMAVAHLSHHWPDAKLVHLFDSSRPTIGVGEGTTPDFLKWLASVGVSQNDLTEYCRATPKRGLQFEGWGSSEPKFEHEFLPRSQQAVHFSAARLPELLSSVSQCERVDDSLECIHELDDRVEVVTACMEKIEADLVIDARGFPADAQIERHSFDWITTTSALVTKSPVVVDSNVTRAVARPLGWIFSIPLQNETSYGYVYNNQTSTETETERDFSHFLRQEKTGDVTPLRNLSFPNFCRRNVFVGRVLHIGNTASFMEPLEATAIGVITLQLQLLSHWRRLIQQGMPTPLASDRINRIHEDTLVKVSIFIAWHYAAGSQFDTAFWRNARDQFLRLKQQPALNKILADFNTMQEQTGTVSIGMLDQLNLSSDLTRVGLQEAMGKNFGGYSVLSFVQIARGLGQHAAANQSSFLSTTASPNDFPHLDFPSLPGGTS